MKEGVMLYPDGEINYEIFDHLKDFNSKYSYEEQKPTQI
jgi:hypothetical protein